MAKVKVSSAGLGVDGRMTVTIVRASAICAEVAQRYGGGLWVKVGNAQSAVGWKCLTSAARV